VLSSPRRLRERGSNPRLLPQLYAASSLAITTGAIREGANAHRPASQKTCRRVMPWPGMRPAEVIVRWIIAAIAFACASAAHAEPRRVVSLDYCADQFVLALADRAQITALSIGSQRDDSYFRGRARGMRQTRGTLEEVLALRPDLVIRNWGGSWDARAGLWPLRHVPVLQVGDTPDFVTARADLLDAAQTLGHPRTRSVTRSRSRRAPRTSRDTVEAMRRLCTSPVAAPSRAGAR
jgi:hypothetical protein